MMASASFFEAILRAAVGISKEPGTHTTSICSGGTPWRLSVFSQPSRSREVMNSLKRETMTAKRSPWASNDPSNVRPCPFRRLAMRLQSKEQCAVRPRVYVSGGAETRGYRSLAVALRQLERAAFGDVGVGELVRMPMNSAS